MVTDRALCSIASVPGVLPGPKANRVLRAFLALRVHRLTRVFRVRRVRRVTRAIVALRVHRATRVFRVRRARRARPARRERRATVESIAGMQTAITNVTWLPKM